MPEAETSQFQKSLKNLPSIDFSKHSLDSSEPQEVHLLIVEDDKGSREFTLNGEVYSIGRDPSCNIRLFSMFVSRRHATLVRQQQEDGNYKYQIIDGDQQGQRSANGILINGRKLQTHDLVNEDKIVFGPGVSAKYQRLKSGPLDPYDITLIDPGMME
ncbi:MAG: FHA domain-containing protein [Coleofasciculus sp. Co-bin14]|nr:FHA domain-containing protein [Coleofasciculus sp. Co-bin14]